MFARRRRRFRGKGFREPTMWDRFPVSVLNNVNIAGATVGSVILWDPTSVVAGHQDLRLTQMRLMVDGGLVVGYTFSSVGAAGDEIIIPFNFGVYMGTNGELRNPSLADVAGEQTDWLFLQHTFATVTPSGAITAANAAFFFERNLQNQAPLLDIRSKRKLEQDEQLIMSFNVPTTNSAYRNGSSAFNISTAVIAGQLFSSVLYKRTGR